MDANNHTPAASPKNTAERQLSRLQVAGLVVVMMFALLAVLNGAGMTLLIVVVNVCIALYAALQLFNFYAFVSASSASVLPDLTQAARALPAATLPTYAILVPLYKETAVLEQLIGNLQRLNYPAAKLDVILLIEADDTDMIAALQRLKLQAARALPGHLRASVLPPHQAESAKCWANAGDERLPRGL